MLVFVPDQTSIMLVSSYMQRHRMGTQRIGILVVGAKPQWSNNMWVMCSVTINSRQINIFSPHQTQEFILTPDGKTIKEDVTPSLKKLFPVPDGFMVQSIAGVRTRIVSRLDGKGYNIAKCRFPIHTLLQWLNITQWARIRYTPGRWSTSTTPS